MEQVRNIKTEAPGSVLLHHPPPALLTLAHCSLVPLTHIHISQKYIYIQIQTLSLSLSLSLSHTHTHTHTYTHTFCVGCCIALSVMGYPLRLMGYTGVQVTCLKASVL